MSQSAEFANHFARLTAALVRQGDDVEEQQQYLLSAVAAAKFFPVLLTRDGDALLADGSPIAKSTIYTMVLADRLKGHNVVRLEVNPAPSPADVYGLARVLATAPEDGANSDVGQRLAAMRAASVRVEVAATQKARVDVTSPTAPMPRVSLESFELMSEDQMRSAIARPASRTGTPTSSPITELSGPKAGATIEQLLKALDDASDIGTVENVLVALIPHVESALNGPNPEDAVIAARRIARREARTTDEQTRKLISQILRRLVTSKMITTTMKQLPGAGDKLPEYASVLSHAGDPAVEALAERLVESEQAKERRAIFNVLVQLKSGVPIFIHMLGDKRWFVIRNAADLLAQIGAPEAEEPLIRALDVADARARRSVIAALARYPSPKSQGSVRRALQDPAVEVRLAAAAGVGRTKSAEMTKALLEAFGREQDAEVRQALLGALGRQATEDAVRQLVDAAAPDSLFKRKTSGFRVAAVRALREAGTPAAFQAVRSLIADKDPAVRDAATKSAK
jgi:hypothetical protein